MNKTIKFFGISAVFALLFMVSCTKEETANPVANFTFAPNDTIFYTDTLTFTNTSTDADSYLWNFGDGTTSTSANPTKLYSDDAVFGCDETFTITLTATKKGKTSTVSKNVVVYFCS